MGIEDDVLLFHNRNIRAKIKTEQVLPETMKTGEMLMQMYEVTALSEDMQTEIDKEIIFAEDEDDAIDRMQEKLQDRGVKYGICMASEI